MDYDQAPEPKWYDNVNKFLWPDCAVCAGWRGVFFGAVLVIAIASIF